MSMRIPSTSHADFSSPDTKQMPVPEPTGAPDMLRACGSAPNPPRWWLGRLSGVLLVVLVFGSLLMASLALAQAPDNPAEPTVVTGGPARNSHSATLLQDGRVLVVGGWDGASTAANADVYDPHTQVWAPSAALSTARSFHTATRLPDGRVLVTGGWDNLSQALTSTEIFEPTTRAWQPAAPLQAPRAGHVALALQDGRVLVAAGCAGQGVQRSTEVYDPQTDAWQSAGALVAARCGAAGLVLEDGRVLVIGGYDQSGQALASVELYDPARNAWAPTAPLTTPRAGHSATLLDDGRVLVAGGFNGAYLASAEVYDPATNTWTLVGELQAPRAYHTAVLLNTGAVWVAGGSAGSQPLLETETFAPQSGQWTPAESLPAPYGLLEATLLDDGRVLITGRAAPVENVSPEPTSTPEITPWPEPPTPTPAPNQESLDNRTEAAPTNSMSAGIESSVETSTATASSNNYSAGNETARLYGVHEILFGMNPLSPGTNHFDAPPMLTFTSPSGKEYAVRSFYMETRTVQSATKDIWAARAYVTEVGEWTWSAPTSAVNATTGAALTNHEVFAAEEAPASGLHGMLRVTTGISGPGKRWYTDDGLTLLPIADTAYRLFFEMPVTSTAGAQISNVFCPTTTLTITNADSFVTQYASEVSQHGVNVLRVEAMGNWAYTDEEIAEVTNCKNADGTNRPCNRLDDCNPDLNLFFSQSQTGSTDDLFDHGPSYAQAQALTLYPNKQSLDRTDRKLKLLLNEFPSLYVQLLIVPEPQWGKNSYWMGPIQISPDVRRQLWQAMLSRWAAFPNVFWSISNDLGDTATYSRNQALAKEVGCYWMGPGNQSSYCSPQPPLPFSTFGNDPWRLNRPMSLGHLRDAVDSSRTAPWHTYITAYSTAELSAQQMDGKIELDSTPVIHNIHSYSTENQPTLNVEDCFEEAANDAGNLYMEVKNPDYYFRRLLWSHLLSGSGASYGAYATWTGLSTYATGWYATPISPQIELTGLNSVQHIDAILRDARVDLAQFTPNDNLVSQSARNQKWGEYDRAQVSAQAPQELLAYFPNTDQSAGADPDQAIRRGAIFTNTGRIATITLTDFTAPTYYITWYDPATGQKIYPPPGNQVAVDGNPNRQKSYSQPLQIPARDAILHLSSRCVSPNACLSMDDDPEPYTQAASGGFYVDRAGADDVLPTIASTLNLTPNLHRYGTAAWLLQRPYAVPDYYRASLRYVFPVTQSVATLDYDFRTNDTTVAHMIQFGASTDATQDATSWLSLYHIAIEFLPGAVSTTVGSGVYEAGEWLDWQEAFVSQIIEPDRWYHMSLKVTKLAVAKFKVEAYLDGQAVCSREFTRAAGDAHLRAASIASIWSDGPRLIDSVPSSVWWDELVIDPPASADRGGLFRTQFQDGLASFDETQATYFDGAAGYDGSSFLRVGASNYNKGLLRFDVAQIPPDAVVDEAILTLFYAGRSNANTLTLGAHGVLADWDASTANRVQRQTGVNWHVAGMAAGSDYTAAPAATLGLGGDGQAWVDMDITSLAQSWVADASQNHGIVLLQEAASGFVVYDFCSDVAQAPTTPPSPCEAGREPKLTLRYHLLGPAPVKSTFQRGAAGYNGNAATYFDGTSGYNNSPYLRVSSDGYSKSLLRFDMTSIPITETVAEAKLRVYPITRNNANSLTLAAHRVLADWTDAQANRIQRQTGVNWSAAGMVAGADYLADADGTELVSGVGSGWVELDVTDMVQAWVTHPTDNHGLVLLAQAASGSVNYGMCSELGWSPCTAAQAPVLEIWHYPPPTPESEPES